MPACGCCILYTHTYAYRLHTRTGADLSRLVSLYRIALCFRAVASLLRFVYAPRSSSREGRETGDGRLVSFGFVIWSVTWSPRGLYSCIVCIDHIPNSPLLASAPSVTCQFLTWLSNRGPSWVRLFVKLEGAYFLCLGQAVS